MLRNIFLAKNKDSKPDSTIAFKEVDNDLDTTTNLNDEEKMELPIDLIRVGNKLLVKAPIVGATIHDISVTINQDTLTIHKSSMREENHQEKEQTYIQECHWGTLSRSTELPHPVDPDRTRATLNDGVLTIVMPLKHNSYTKIIKIKE